MITQQLTSFGDLRSAIEDCSDIDLISNCLSRYQGYDLERILFYVEQKLGCVPFTGVVADDQMEEPVSRLLGRYEVVPAKTVRGRYKSWHDALSSHDEVMRWRPAAWVGDHCMLFPVIEYESSDMMIAHLALFLLENIYMPTYIENFRCFSEHTDGTWYDIMMSCHVSYFKSYVMHDSANHASRRVGSLSMIHDDYCQRHQDISLNLYSLVTALCSADPLKAIRYGTNPQNIGRHSEKIRTRSSKMLFDLQRYQMTTDTMSLSTSNLLDPDHWIAKDDPGEKFQLTCERCGVSAYGRHHITYTCHPKNVYCMNCRQYILNVKDMIPTVQGR